MPIHIARAMISASPLLLTAASALAAYPTAPEIADRYAPDLIAVRLTDAFVAPKSSTGGGATLGTSEPTYPLAFYNHLDGDAIAGGFVYRGRAIPALQGKFVFGDITNARRCRIAPRLRHRSRPLGSPERNRDGVSRLRRCG